MLSKVGTAVAAVTLSAACRNAPAPSPQSQVPSTTPSSGSAAVLRESDEWVLEGHPQFGGRAVIQGDQLALAFDTMGDGPEHRGVVVDSLSVAALAGEELVTSCGLSPTSHGGDTVGLAADSTPGFYKRPRLAWHLDARTNRLDVISPVSLLCHHEVPVE